MVFSADRRNRTSAIAGPSLQLSCSRQVDQRPDLGSSPIGAGVRLPQKSSGRTGAREGVPWLPRITPPPRFGFFATASTIRLPCERFDDATVDLVDDKGCAITGQTIRGPFRVFLTSGAPVPNIAVRGTGSFAKIQTKRCWREGIPRNRGPLSLRENTGLPFETL